VSIVVASELPSEASLASGRPLGHAFGGPLVAACQLRPLLAVLLVRQRTVGAFGDHPPRLAELSSRLDFASARPAPVAGQACNPPVSLGVDGATLSLGGRDCSLEAEDLLVARAAHLRAGVDGQDLAGAGLQATGEPGDRISWLGHGWGELGPRLIWKGGEI